MQDKAKIGLIGLAVMGANLARNLADKKIDTVVFNRSVERTDAFMAEFGTDPHLFAAKTLEELVEKIARPRKIILMIKAGAPVDAMIDQLVPLLEKGDIIIDGGNSFFEDTRRRSAMLAEKGLEFVGMGVSGGEEGALKGPSLMPGGSRRAYTSLEPIINAIAAKAEGEPCVTYIGTDGAGHYVKMVHNGIEYADMQMIADTYSVMKGVLGLDADEMSRIWASWNEGELSSYLVEITSKILAVKDDLTGKPIVDVILDVAGQKGTGLWTSLNALDLGVAAPTITEAVYARNMSGYKKVRTALETKFAGIDQIPEIRDKKAVLEDLRQSLYAAKICAYAQGFDLISTASRHFGWELDLGAIAKIWRNGCIIRAAFLDRVSDSFKKDPQLENLLFDGYFSDVLKKARGGWGRIVGLAAQAGVPLMAMGSALSYFDALRTGCGNANLIQAQRDYFGAHTYQRTDREGTFHTEWMEK